MTREEAIRELELIAQVTIWNGRREALNMAIEALQTEAIQGVGRYENAMQKLREMPKYLNGIKEKWIKKIPSEAEWIPCSERLPEESYVLCCDNYGEMLIANPFECDSSDTGFSAESDGYYMYNCVAWIPLPKPYRKDSE